MKLYFQKFSSLAHVFYTSATNTFFSFIHASICFITRSFFIIFITEFSYSLHSFSGFFRIIFNIYEIINISYFKWYCLCKKCYIYLHFYSLEKKNPFNFNLYSFEFAKAIFTMANSLYLKIHHIHLFRFILLYFFIVKSTFLNLFSASVLFFTEIIATFWNLNI